MSRFKTASKYRNSVLNIAKKEDWYSFPSSNSVQDPSLLKASTHLFGVRNAINSVALFCLSDSGKLEKPASVLSLGSAVSDFEFSPFGGRKERIGMAVGGEDGSVKIDSTRSLHSHDIDHFMFLDQDLVALSFKSGILIRVIKHFIIRAKQD